MNHLLTPNEIRDILPLPSHAKSTLASFHYQLQKILTGQDTRKLFIIGPCSLHDIPSATEFATHLKHLANEVKESILIVMRAHFEKPRTKGGWKGLLYDPKLDGSEDLQLGILKARRFLIEMACLGLPISTEILDPYLYTYYDELLSYATIGARTATSQIHRQIASSLKIPVGIKNSVDGNIDAAIHGAIVAHKPHQFPSIDSNGRLHLTHSLGNPLAHIILRGSQSQSNFNPHSLHYATSQIETHHLSTPILIDCAHGNRLHGEQTPAFLQSLKYMEMGEFKVIGVMLESYIQEGRYIGQDLTLAPKTLSLTDACLSFEQTKMLVQAAHKRLICVKTPSFIPQPESV